MSSTRIFLERGPLALVLALVIGAVGPSALAAQEADAGGDRPLPVRLEAEPARLNLVRGETAEITVTALDGRGNPVSVPLRVAAPRRALRVRQGSVRGLTPGDHEIVFTAVLPARADARPPTVRVPVTVTWPPVERIEIRAEEGTLYRGTRLGHDAVAFHADGSRRPSPEFTWTSSDPGVATVDRFGRVTASGTGPVTITASLEGARGEVAYRAAEFPGARLELQGGQDRVRVGDVQTFRAVVRTERGAPVPDVPVSWSHAYEPHDSIEAPRATAFQKEGKIVAEVPGIYTVTARAGSLVAERTFEARPRSVVRQVQVGGHGRLSHVYSTDLWVFEGQDGRDYAITGSKYVGGKAFVWDVTDPTNLVLTDSVVVDARVVNDVKVSPDARYAALSREGASDRRNSVIILDLADPAHPTVAAEYAQGLTGGVHNVFATDEHLFALSAGDKYLILDMSDIYNPTYVSEYDHPDSRIHDVWVHDGIAYSAEWGTGVVMVDVGNGRWGGSPENPVFIDSFELPSGRTHAVFPYYSESAERFYLFVGDEILNRRGLPWQGTGPNYRQPYDPETGRGGYPRATSGYVQVVDLTDPESPEMVARYQVKEYGPHNMWVKDDKLYQAHYEGGLRVVDVSGELMGNLYTQDREIAVFKAFDPVGYIPNSPAAWGAMPHKGYIFFSDINSGLWAVKLAEEEGPVM